MRDNEQSFQAAGEGSFGEVEPPYDNNNLSINNDGEKARNNEQNS